MKVVLKPISQKMNGGGVRGKMAGWPPSISALRIGEKREDMMNGDRSPIFVNSSSRVYFFFFLFTFDIFVFVFFLFYFYLFLYNFIIFNFQGLFFFNLLLYLFHYLFYFYLYYLLLYYYYQISLPSLSPSRFCLPLSYTFCLFIVYRII